MKESEYEESKATVEDLRQRLDQEFSISKKSDIAQTPKLREKSPSFYGDLDESHISRHDASSHTTNNSVINTR